MVRVVGAVPCAVCMCSVPWTGLLLIVASSNCSNEPTLVASMGGISMSIFILPGKQNLDAEISAKVCS